MICNATRHGASSYIYMYCKTDRPEPSRARLSPRRRRLVGRVRGTAPMESSCG